jgi:inorganic pyrophosphatase
MQERFWQTLDELVARSEIIIDRPKGSHHPKWDDIVYPMDYGYLKNTTALDGGGIDVWLGSQPERRVTGVIATVDLHKRDSEIKILLGCTPQEAQKALAIHNTFSQGGMLVPR